jgi:hypothetical protein
MVIPVSNMYRLPKYCHVQLRNVRILGVWLERWHSSSFTVERANRQETQ